ncbi:putative peptidase (DUF1758) [Popillia japonica]|uniref:Peptidase (DUF1758) n=1 Tax=Popillia japonica TaxID=7064 RepID=A0AAW1K1M6_POPJA
MAYDSGIAGFGLAIELRNKSTVLVQVRDHVKKWHTIRALLDSGSQSSYVTRRLSDRLRIPTSKVNISVLGLNQTTTTIESECDLEIQSFHNAFSTNVKCFVIPQISGLVPSLPLKVKDIDIPKNIKLADPSFDKPGGIDMLIGANLFWQILSIGNCDIQSQLQKFWEMEECQNDKPLTTEELECEAHFKNHMSRTQNGRFVVTIPLKDSAEILAEILGESYEHAQKRFTTLEKKLDRTPALKQRYVEFMNEYKDLGHMSKVETDKIEKTGYYIPPK